MSDLSFAESFAGTFAEGVHGAYSWKEYWEALVDDHCRFYIPFSAYLWCSAILLAASSVTLAIIHPSLVPGNTLPLWVLVVMGTYQLVQWIMFLNAFYRVVKSVLRRNVFLGKVWQMYLVQVITFAHFYLFLFLTSHTNKDEEDITLVSDQAFAFNADLNESEYGGGSSISGRTIKLVRLDTIKLPVFSPISCFCKHFHTQKSSTCIMFCCFSQISTFFYFSCVIQSSVGYGDIVPNAFYSQIAVAIQMLLGMIYSVVIISQVLFQAETFCFD
jgi:hypothetical protein